MIKKNIKKSALLSFILIFSLNIFLPTVSAIATIQEFFKNSGFEEGTSYWYISKQNSNVNVEADNTIKKEGLSSIKMYNNTTTATTCSILQKVNISQSIGKAIKLKQWQKSDKLSGDIQIKSMFLGENDVAIGEADIKSINIKGSTDWNEQQFTINIPNDPKIKNVKIYYLYNNAIGTLWLDGISVEQVEQIQTSNLIKNGDFEEGQSYWYSSKQNSNVNVEIDNTTKKEGLSSIKMYNNTTTAATCSILQKIDISKSIGKSIKLKQWQKSDKLSGNIQIKASFLGENDVVIGDTDVKSINIKGSTDWNEQQFIIDIPNDLKIKNIKIYYLYNNSIGTLWIDGISSEQVDQIQTSNIFKNGNFEEGISYWNLWGKDINIELDNTTKKEGYSSIKLDNQTQINTTGILSQTIKFKENLIGETFEVKHWVKTDGLSGDGIVMRAKFFDNNDIEIKENQIYSLEISQNQDWKQLQYNIVLPENIYVKSMQIEYLYSNCTGTIWLDDISISKKAVKENRDLIKNGGFEATIKNPVDSWNVHNSKGEIKAGIDTQDKKQGNNSIKLFSSSTNNTGELIQTLDLSENFLGKTLRLSQWLKTNNLNLNYFIFTIKFLNSSGVEVDERKYKNINIPNNSDWTLYQDNIDIPLNKEITKVEVSYGIKEGSGTIWIDDVKMEPYNPIHYITATPSLISLNKGEVKKINLDIDEKNATHKQFKIYSMDKEIVTIDSNNQVTAIKQGITKIRVEEQYQGFIQDIPVIVGKDNSILVNEVTNMVIKGNEILKDKVNTKLTTKKLKYSLLIDGIYGYVNVKDDGSFEYYPNKKNYGKDTFTIKIEDNMGNIALAQYNIQIQKSDAKPIGNDFFVTLTQEEGQATGLLKVKDIYNEKLQFSIRENPKNGVFKINGDGTYTFTSNKDFFGYDTVKIDVNSGTNNNITLVGTIYVAPSTKQLTEKLNNVHPRILANKDDFENIKNLIKTDSNAKLWFENLNKKADKILNIPVVPYQLENGLKLHTTSKDYIELLSFMYKITEDKKYADRAWKEIDNICKYKDWNEKEFLDTSAMSVAASIGYDWLYEYLDDNQRKFIEDTIINKSLKLSIEYTKNNSNFYVKADNNWNVVCNSATILSGLAISNSENRDITTSSVQNALKYMQYSLTKYYVDGSSVEGAGYWEYSIQYLMYGLSSVESALNLKNHFNTVLDFEKISKYPLYISDEIGAYNYADSHSINMAGYYSLWFAKELNDPKATEYHKLYKNKIKDFSIYDLLWYDPKLYNSSTTIPLDMYFDNSKIVTMRSDFYKDENVFMGFKGGTNGVAHGDLDIGSFVYDALGIRWALDLGIQDYNVPNYWDDNGTRWRYYRKRAEGHNTLTIGKSKNEDQVVGATANIIDSKLDVDNPYAVLDMTEAYADKAVKVQRTVKFLNNRNNLIINDEFILKKEDEVIWQMHTEAQPQIIDGGRTVLLTKDGKTIKMKINSDCNALFEIVDAVRYEYSPNPTGQTPNTGVKKIIARAKAKSGNITVTLLAKQEDNGGVSTADFNTDGIIDIKDLAIIATHYNTKKGEIEYDGKYDIKPDCSIDIYDLVMVAKQF